MYCSTKGRCKPILRSKSAMDSAVACSPSTRVAGLPGVAWRIRKTRDTTPIRVGIKSKNLLIR